MSYNGIVEGDQIKPKPRPNLPKPPKRKLGANGRGRAPTKAGIVAGDQVKAKPQISKKISQRIKMRLESHRDNHIKNGNNKNKVSNHMRQMIKGLKNNLSFAKSHKEAQKLYPMK